MGKRSRKRAADWAEAAPREPAVVPAPPAPRTATWKADPGAAPNAPWHPFPLNEIGILVALVLLVGAFAFATGDRRVVMVVGSILIITLAAGELAIREHFAGFRSHTTLLAGLLAVLVAAALYETPLPQPGIIAVALTVFAVAIWRLRRTFVARSGGVGFRA